jgi:hypothetical protein
MEFKKFNIKFRHISAVVTVWKRKSRYKAYLRFPKCYMQKDAPKIVFDEIIAGNIDNACEMAKMLVLQHYSFLNKKLRGLDPESFVITRSHFRSYIIKPLKDKQFVFTFTKQYYALSENVQGKYYHRSQFVNKEMLSALNCVLFINYDKVISIMNMAGFNYKFINKVLRKCDTVKLSALKQVDDGNFKDTVMGLNLSSDDIKLPASKVMFYKLLDQIKYDKIMGNKP